MCLDVLSGGTMGCSCHQRIDQETPKLETVSCQQRAKGRLRILQESSGHVWIREAEFAVGSG